MNALRMETCTADPQTSACLPASGDQTLSRHAEDQFSMDVHLRIAVITSLGVFGAITNLMSVAVFLKQGVKDCVSICLVSLGVADFAALLFGLLTMFCNAAMRINSNLDLRAHYNGLYHACGMFYHISTLTTTFISLERCLCVSMPFKFKTFITMKRSIFVNVAIYLYAAGISLPLYISAGANFATNATSSNAWLTPEKANRALFIITTLKFTVEPACLVSILISTYIMIVSLKKSTRLRLKGTSALGVLPQSGDLPALPVKKSEKEMKTSNNVRVSKTVASLAMICFICNSLRYVVVVVILVSPDIDVGRDYEKLFFLLLDVIFLLQTANASANIFVYNVFNALFRRTFQSMFCLPCHIRQVPEERT